MAEIRCIHHVELTLACHWCKEQAARIIDGEAGQEDAYRLLYLGPDGILKKPQSDAAVKPKI
jgi:hypothetical protein